MTAARRRHLLGWLALAAAALSSSGCNLLPRPTHVPMDTLRLNGPCAGPAPVLLVMLPGAYSRPQEFVDEGFVAAVRSRGIAADVLIADAHLGYFSDKTILDRLREDIVLPARAQGYRRIWLVGISLGGFASLGYGVRHGSEIDGIVVLAPYLGSRTLLQEIVVAGGPRAWRATMAPIGPGEVDREFWAWLAGPAPGSPALPVYLGSGRDDRFADAHALLTTLLPPERVTTAPGGHDWPVWRTLWNGWLDRGLLPTACAAEPASPAR